MRRLLAWWCGRPRALRWGALLAEMLAIWLLSARRIDAFGAGALAALAHNGCHVVAYGVMGGLAVTALRGATAGRARQCWRAVAIAVAYGAVDELHQHFVPGRISSGADLLADAAGAWLGVSATMGFLGGRGAWRQVVAAAGCSAAAVLLATFTTW